MAASLRSWIRTSVLFQNIKSTPQTNLTWCRNFRVTCRLRQEEDEEPQDETNENGKNKPIRKVVDVDTSIRYLNSKAFVQGYGDKPVWFYYRRNFKNQIPPRTRRSCLIKGEIATASPCPVCRDEYLVLDARNTKLLEQFISPYSGEILEEKKTGLCQMQQKKLIVEVMKAWDEGRLEMKLPFRTYNYEDYKS